MIEKIEKYSGYELNHITVGERKDMYALQGVNDNWGMESVPVLPLDGWRGRNLAEVVFGSRDAGLWELGTIKLVKAKDLQALSGWDGCNTDYLANFNGIVIMEVVAVDHSYARFIRIEQMPMGKISDYYQQQVEESSKRLEALRANIDVLEAEFEELDLVELYGDPEPQSNIPVLEWYAEQVNGL